MQRICLLLQTRYSPIGERYIAAQCDISSRCEDVMVSRKRSDFYTNYYVFLGVRGAAVGVPRDIAIIAACWQRRVVLRQTLRARTGGSVLPISNYQAGLENRLSPTCLSWRARRCRWGSPRYCKCRGVLEAESGAKTGAVSPQKICDFSGTPISEAGLSVLFVRDARRAR